MSETAFDPVERLVMMARQIADFFRSYPQDKAAAAVADHINQFWTRRMRDDFLAGAHAHGVDQDPLIVEAMASIRPGGTGSPN